MEAIPQAVKDVIQEAIEKNNEKLDERFKEIMKAIRELKSAGVEPEVAAQNQIRSKENEKPERRESNETEGSNLPKEERPFPVWKFDFNRVIPFGVRKTDWYPGW